MAAIASSSPSPCISGRVVLPVSNAMSKNQGLVKAQWLKKGRDFLSAEEDLVEEQRQNALAALNAIAGAGAGSNPSAAASSINIPRSFSKAQLDGLAQYYDSRNVPTHIAVDLYGLDCPVSSSFFAHAASVLAASSSSVTSSSSASSSQWVVSAVIPDHAVIIEHSSIVCPSPTANSSSSSSSSSSACEEMKAIGKSFIESIGAALVHSSSSSPAGTASSVSSDATALLAPILSELMRQETSKLGAIGAVKPIAAADPTTAAFHAKGPESKRTIASKAGLVYMVRSNKAVAMSENYKKQHQQNNSSGASTNAATDDACEAMGQSALTLIVTLSTRSSVADLLGAYVANGNALLVGEVCLEAPKALQPLLLTANNSNSNAASSSSALSQLQRPTFPSVGALWLFSGVALCVPSTIRSGQSEAESYSKIYTSNTNHNATAKVSDVWDLFGTRPNRLLTVKKLGLSGGGAKAVVAHPLIVPSSPSAPNNASQQQQQVQQFAVSLAWQLFLGNLWRHAVSIFGAANEASVKAVLFGANPNAPIVAEGGGVLGTNKKLSMGLVAQLSEGLKHSSASAARSVLGSANDNAADESASTSSLAPSATGETPLAEMFLLSSDDEASLAAEGLSASDLAKKDDSAAGPHLATTASGRVLTAKEIALQLLESTARGSHATLLAANGGIALAPSEKVLFVAKLNPLTTAGGLATCFEQFGRVVSCEVPKDLKSGRSKCYAFVEFETEEACNAAYAKMGGVMIDNCAIHVDFCQSTRKEELELLAKQREAARAAREAQRAQRAANKRPREGEEGISNAVGGGQEYPSHPRRGGGGLDPATFANMTSLLPLPPPAAPGPQ